MPYSVEKYEVVIPGDLESAIESVLEDAAARDQDTDTIAVSTKKLLWLDREYHAYLYPDDISVDTIPA